MLLIGLGYWAYQGLHEAIGENRVKSLERLLGTVVAAVDVWVGDHRAETARLARERDVVVPAIRVAQAARAPGARGVDRVLLNDADELMRQVRANTVMSQAATVRLVDRNGVVIASEDAEHCGRRLRSTVFRQKLDLAIDGKPQVVRPFPDPELRVADKDGQSRPLLWFLAPVRGQDGQAAAVLAMGVVRGPGVRAPVLAAERDRAGRRLRVRRRRPAAHAEPLRRGARRRGRDSRRVRGAARVHDPRARPGRQPGGGPPLGLEPAARPLTEPAALALAARAKRARPSAAGPSTSPTATTPASNVSAHGAGCRPTTSASSPRSRPPRRSRRCATCSSRSR